MKVFPGFTSRLPVGLVFLFPFVLLSGAASAVGEAPLYNLSGYELKNRPDGGAVEDARLVLDMALPVDSLLLWPFVFSGDADTASFSASCNNIPLEAAPTNDLLEGYWNTLAIDLGEYGGQSGEFALTLSSAGGATVLMVTDMEEALSALPEMQAPVPISGGTSTARFFAGATADQGATYPASFAASDSIRIEANILPEQGHAGQPGSYFLVAAVTPPGGELAWYQKDSNGQFVAWNGHVSGLVSVEESAALKASHTLSVYQGPLFPATFSIFFGYQAEGGPLIYSAVPLVIQVAQ